MITKEELLEAMQRECDICIHLHGKIPEGGVDYRPSEKQRSTLELLRYLSFVGLGMSRSLAEGDWAPYTALGQAAEGVAAEDFPAAMAKQKEGLGAFFATLTDADLQERRATLPWGEEYPLGRALMEMPYACLVAYRMQLFLYAKAAGNDAITTPNCWAGVDMDA